MHECLAILRDASAISISSLIVAEITFILALQFASVILSLPIMDLFLKLLCARIPSVEILIIREVGDNFCQPHPMIVYY